MKDIVYVSGHRNPDSDSICSAIAYSYLLNKLGKYNAVPVRLGEISRETEFILKKFNLEHPNLLTTVKQKVEDLDYDKITVFSKDLTMKTSWSLMQSQNLKSAPIQDDHGHLLGLLSTSNMIEGFMSKWDCGILKDACTPIENVIDTLEANIVYLSQDLKTITGDIHIAAMRGEEAQKRIGQGDVIIVGGDRDDAINALIPTNPSLIILTGGLSIETEMLTKLKEHHISVITTEFNTYLTSQQIIQAIPVEYIMQKENLYTLSTDDTVEYVKEIMKETRFRSYPVIDLNNHCVGSVSRFALLQGDKKKVILVDHNERGQSIPGIEEAEILEIIDHHRVADIQTVGPLLFRGEPVGCSATIIAKIYAENDVEIPPHIAGAMLGAIISDTLLFKSPTCTPIDTKIAKQLAKIVNVELEPFAMELFKAGTSLVGKTVEEIFNQDYKRFAINENQVGVAQVNSMDIEGFLPYKEEMLAYMEIEAKNKELDFTLLLLTDVINGNSEIFVAGPRPEQVSKAFNVELVEQQATLPGVISRKKQVVPAITAVYS